MRAPPYSSLPRLKRIAREITKAADTVVTDYRNGRIGEEEDITASMVQAIKDATGSRRSRSGVSWQAAILRRRRGVAAEETRHGAELLAIAEINYGGQVVAKGFLGQA